MKKLYPVIQAKSIPVTVRAFLFIVLVFTFLMADAQTVVTNPASPWTVPAGVTSITVYLWGGGGGGGGGNNSGNAWGNGGGGGGGGCGYATIAVTPGTSCTLSIGGGGAAGTSGGGNGGNGGTTSFTIGASTWSASGGAGGKGSTAATGATFAGGAGGSTFVGTGIAGNAGGTGSTGYDASAIVGTGGGGGGSGGAGTSPTSGVCGGTAAGGTGTYPGGNGSYNTKCGGKDQVGLAGVAPGGGGSGADSYNNNYAGGTGGAGEVIIVYSTAPTITSFTPTSECSGSFSTVTITGTNFTGATAVKFNGTAAASYTVVSATSITATPAAGTTTGTISVTTAGGTATSAGSFTVNTPPTATITPSGATTLCAGSSVTLTTSGGGTYAWSSGPTTAAITVSPASTTTYTVTVTSAAGCTATASQTVTINSNPTAAITPAGPSSFCTSGTLTASGGGTYQWNATGGNATTAAITASTGGTYVVTVTNASGCTASASNVVTINTPPTASITPSGATTFCSGGSVTLTASGGGTYAWSSGPTMAAITVSPASTTTYTVTVTSAAGCTATASQTVTINTVPTAVTVSPASTTQCGGTVTLTASGGTGGTIYWENTTSNGTSTATASSSQSVAASGTYYFRADNACGWSTQGSAAVTINALPAVNPITGTTTVCAGSTTALADATIGGTWSSSNTSVATVNILGVVTGVSAGTATISYTVTNILTGCSNAATAIVTINALPSAAIAPAGPSTFCGPGTLTASGGSTYLWNATGGNATTAAITASASGTYTVTVTSAAGCTAAASNIVTVNPIPAAAITPAGPSTFCGSGTLTASGGATYLWNATGGNATTAAITASASGTYTVTVTSAAGCTASASNNVTINALPSAAIAPAGPSTFCGPGTLTASGGGTYLWNATGGNATTAAITASASGTYTVTVTSAAGCTAAASNTVTVNPVPAAPTAVTASPATICVGQSSNLTATSAGNTIRWWTAASGGSLITTVASGTNYAVSPASTTTYYAEAYTAAGCASATRVAVTVTVNPVPSAVTVSPASTTQCGGTVTLTATGGTGGTIYWENTTSGGTSTATPSSSQTVSSSGTYYFNALQGSCWGTQGSATVTINPVPAAPTAVTATPAAICVGQTSQLNATSAGNTIRWWTAASGGSLITTVASGTNYAVSPASTTTYYAEAYTAAGCASATRVAVTVTVNTIPAATITPSGPTTLCAGNSVTLTAGGGSTYLWNNAATTAAITVSPASTTTYAVTVTSAAGCTATASQTVTVNPVPTPAVNSVSICPGGSATLNATAGYAAYSWNTGAATASITVTPAATTTYTVTVTNTFSCTATASGTVTVVPNPTPTVNNPAKCAGGTDTLIASGGGAGYTYLWSTGATTDTITTTVAGVYKVTVTNSTGCSATAQGIATINALPTPTVANDTVCTGIIATLTATGGVVYVWSTGAHTASITTATPGTYTVTATSLGGCTASATGLVVDIANPAVTVTNGVICSGAATTITASGAASYVWSTGNTTAGITVSSAGSYTVTGTSSYGCTASATSTVISSTNPTPTVNNPSICQGTSAMLTATGGATYIWSTGATTAAITVSPASTTTYKVTASNAAGCSATASGTVTVNSLPAASATNGSICSGSAATLTASGGGTYHWSTGATTASISTLIAGTYNVTVTNALGCSATASATATVAVAPVATVNSASVCKGTAQTLTATITIGGPCTYLWSTGATTGSISVTPASNTTYTVTVTNTAGCTASASGTVTVYSVPSVTAGSNSPVLLNGTINLTSTVSSGTSPYTYSWSGPSAFASVVANPSVASAQPTNSGTYYITVTDAHTCTATASANVILNFTSPGGIPSNDALWLMANTGVTTSGSNVTKWNDQSGLANNATVINGTAPTLVNSSVNSYPIVNFAGAGGAQGYFGTKITSSSVSSFIVANVASASSAVSGMFSIVAAGGTDHSNTNSAVMFQKYSATGVGSVRNNATDGNYTGATTMGQYHLLTSIYSGTANTNYFYHEGVTASNAAYPSTAFADTLYTVGSRYAAGAGNYLTGQIGEVILFNTALTAAQKNQVESYLATKYGFTLDQTTATNYVASNGTVFWNAAGNGTYKNNIFGVGIDNISTLSQTQSVSINTNQLSINTAAGLTFYSFLMVSDNGIADTLQPAAGLPNSINAALTTVWRASQTGSRGTENIVLNTSTVNFNYYAAIASSMTPYLLVDSNHDGIYETYVAASSTSGSNITFNYSLNDGALFTFGFKASIDYGDAWAVPTTTANNGAGHMIVPGVYLGSLIDAEVDGQPSVNALGDDTIGLADEDGVNFNIGVPTSVNIVTMGSNTISVVASTAGYLNAWADLNQDSVYEMSSEYVIINQPLVAGTNTITFNVSDSVQYGPTSMRFRFAQHLGDVTAPTGLATNGEVEDYKIYVTAPLVGPCTNGFQNPSFELGPDPSSGTGYIITSETNLPYWRTTATDHMIEQWHSGFLGIPAYNGTYFCELEANLFGALYQDVYTTPGTKLSWSFAHHGRLGSDTAQLRIGPPGATVYQATAIDGNTAWGVHSGFYTVPAGQYITRLEFWAVGSYGGDKSIGNELDQVSVISSFDYGDAPNSYGTYFANNGPYHSIVSNLYLGYGVTCDADGKPSAAANLDSLDDGITFPAPCNGCNTYTVSINAFNNSGNPATIAGWIDFNKNGTFDNNERASVTIPSSATEQTVSMTFNVTAFSSVSTSTYGRFRIANDSTQIALPTGFASTGEVEDYLIPCVALPKPIPVVSTPACARGPLTLFASDSAYSTWWVGPNGINVYQKDTTINSIPAADSGTYTVYAIYSNGCVTDSPVNIKVQNCYVNINGNIFDDANGNGLIDGTDITTDHGQTIYAVLSDNTNTVLQTAFIAANGSFSFTNAPAYMSGMTILTRTSAPVVGGASGGSQWPANWTGTKEQYGTNNLAGSGVDPTPNLLAVTTGKNNITGALLGYDQLPITTPQTYTIPYPHLNSQMDLVPANALGWLAGSDPEDGTYTAGSTFTITSLAGMNGNQLYYDANGDGTLQSYEQITGYTTITNFDPTKLFIKFTGAGSTSATFTYGSTDLASKVDPAPATYTIKWMGALPVKMLYFTADKIDGTQSLLKWATASEINNDHFDVERSADAENWEKIGQVKGAGTTEVETDYSFTDASPLQGVNYYRLKQVDVDGRFEYTNIAQVTFGGNEPEQGTTTLSVYPNPLNQPSKLNIALNTSINDNITEVSIVNEIGQVVYNTSLPEIQNYQVIGLNLPAGVYIVSVRTQANNQLTSRLVITK